MKKGLRIGFPPVWRAHRTNHTTRGRNQFEIKKVGERLVDGIWR